MKKSKSIMLLIAPVLSTILFNACGGSGGSESTTRDVYQSKEDCIKDWGEEELCQQMEDDDANEYRRSGGVFIAGRPFWGPQYYPSDRAVIYKGKTISPYGKSTSMKPFVVSSGSSYSSRSSVSSPRSTSYGGFGSRSSGGSSSSSS
jgi:hypothetical protein